MKIAIVSDIHSNCYALEAVIKEAENNIVSGYIVLGDIFGYYPWPYETYKLLQSIPILKIVKGNHDILLTEEKLCQRPSYLKMAVHNRHTLERICPEALVWLADLNFNENFTVEGVNCQICHGTPEDPIEGRYYPDDLTEYDWLQVSNRVVMLGHTHHPFYKKNDKNSIILNPGSVGQPRDGNVFPSWGIFDFASSTFELKRTLYDVHGTVACLISLNWDKRSIVALLKNYTGRLRV